MSVRPRSIAGIAVAAVIGAGALFVLPAAGFASDAAETTELVRHPHDRLTDEQRECLAEQGITRPDDRPSLSERRALRQQLRDAAEACGIERPLRDGRHRPGCGRDGGSESDPSESSSNVDPAVLPAA